MWRGFEFEFWQGLVILVAFFLWLILSAILVSEEARTRKYFADKKPTRKFKSWWIGVPECSAIAALITMVAGLVILVMYGAYGVVAGAFTAVFL